MVNTKPNSDRSLLSISPFKYIKNQRLRYKNLEDVNRKLKAESEDLKARQEEKNGIVAELESKNQEMAKSLIVKAEDYEELQGDLRKV